jgi:hypothetical protein
VEKYKLLSPIKLGTIEIAELEIPNEIKAGHLRNMKMDNPTFDDWLNLIGNATKQPKSVMNELGMKDFQALSEKFGALLGEVISLGTGKS